MKLTFDPDTHTVDSWTTQVWSMQPHLNMDFFSIVNTTAVCDTWLLNPEDAEPRIQRNSVQGGPAMNYAWPSPAWGRHPNPFLARESTAIYPQSWRRCWRQTGKGCEFKSEHKKTLPSSFQCFVPWQCGNGNVRLMRKKSQRSCSVHSVAQSCPTLCNPMNCNTPGLAVHHQLLESTQTHALLKLLLLSEL